MGLIFLTISFPYFIMCFLLPIINQNWSTKSQFIACFCIFTVGLVLAGPSLMLGFDDSDLWVVLLGFFIIGFATPLVIVPTIPETIRGVQN